VQPAAEGILVLFLPGGVCQDVDPMRLVLMRRITRRFDAFVSNKFPPLSEQALQQRGEAWLGDTAEGSDSLVPISPILEEVRLEAKSISRLLLLQRIGRS
jgi:hypothetical protein